MLLVYVPSLWLNQEPTDTSPGTESAAGAAGAPPPQATRTDDTQKTAPKQTPRAVRFIVFFNFPALSMKLAFILNEAVLQRPP